MATCASCGNEFRLADYDEYSWELPICDECSKAKEAGEVLALFRIGANDQALVALAEISTAWPDPESLVQTLIGEADYFARRGDLDEAAVRLRCLAEPKWSREEECKQQYNAAMIETRRAREACA